MIAPNAVSEPDVPVLSAEGVVVRFRGRSGLPALAVDGVDLSVRKGEILALVGESGCGKTTLARTLLGLERPTAGRVVVDGTPLRYDRKSLREYRRTVQLVLQDPAGALNPRHCVYEAVAEGLRVHGMTARTVRRPTATRGDCRRPRSTAAGDHR
jgi:ABC-type glutathione transport system ATPase component